MLATSANLIILMFLLAITLMGTSAANIYEGCVKWLLCKTGPLKTNITSTIVQKFKIIFNSKKKPTCICDNSVFKMYLVRPYTSPYPF